MKNVSDFFRMWVWAAIGLTVLFLIGRPEQVLVVAYKASLVSIAAFIGYWVDRNLFSSFGEAGRLDKNHDAMWSVHAAYRRALIVAAVVLAFALGL